MPKNYLYTVIRLLYNSQPKIHLQSSLQSYNWMKNHRYGKTNHHIRAAAFLHNIGNLLQTYNNNQRSPEELGSNWLKDFSLSEYVYVPILHHATAKRYLVTTRPGYYNSLSKTSQLSFAKGGGFLTYPEIRDFEDNSFFKDSLLLRECIDKSKSFTNVSFDDIESDIEKDILDSIIDRVKKMEYKTLDI